MADLDFTRDDLKIETRAGLGLAHIMARKGVTAARIGAALGLAAPQSPARAANEELALIGAGPGVWLAVREDAPEDWAETLAGRLAGLASVSDQSGGYLVLRVSGPAARELIQRGAFIDLDPAVFGPGAAAVTDIAHMGAMLWALEAPDGFEIAIFRSYAASFAHWIQTASAGLDHGASIFPR